MENRDLLERMDYIEISVTDLEQSVKWYTDNFGFKQDYNDGGLAVLFPPNDFPPVGLPTLLLCMAGKNPNWFSDSNGNKHAIIGFHTKKINDLHVFCLAKSINCTEIRDEGFAYFMEFFDQDDNMFSVIELKK